MNKDNEISVFKEIYDIADADYNRYDEFCKLEGLSEIYYSVKLAKDFLEMSKL